jgi:hypothetical protein
MKTLRFLLPILALLWATAPATAQPITGSGWFRAPDRTITNLPPADGVATEETTPPQIQAAGQRAFSLLSQM